MIRPDFQKWTQTAEEMRCLSIEADHPRSRERYQALYLIGSGLTNASQWAKTIKRCKQTVLTWIHEYNTAGPSGVTYHHSGGRPPQLNDTEKKSSLTP